MQQCNFVVALIALSVVASCRASDDRPASARDPVRDSIAVAIERSLDATRRKDIDVFMAGFAPDFALQATDGNQGTLADLRAHTLRDWGIIPATRDLWMRIDSVGMSSPDSAVVYTSQRWDRLMLQRDGIARDTVVTTQKHRELWRHTTSGWKQARITELGGTVMVNGKPYP